MWLGQLVTINPKNSYNKTESCLKVRRLEDEQPDDQSTIVCLSKKECMLEMLLSSNLRRFDAKSGCVSNLEL